MDISETNEGIEVKTSSYRLFLERAGGFAARQVEIFGPGRLDRFDRPGEGPHPTCMHFDNMTVNNTFQLAHYGKINESVTASVDGSQLKLSGHLIPIIEGTSGSVSIEKTMRFEDDMYDVDVHLRFEDTGPIDFASVWWDVNDTWLRAMRSSAGVFMPLQVGIGDSASIMAALRSPEPDQFPAGGMKYWDGPDDADAGEGVSHGCINLDLINCELSGAEPLDIEDLQCAYRVFLSGPTVVRSAPRTEQD